MLYEPGFDHDAGGLKLLPDFGPSDEGALQTADWAQALLDYRASRDADRFVEADDPRPEMPPLIAFDSDLLKERDDFLLFGAGEPDPFEGLPDGGNPGDIPVNVRIIPGTAISITIGDIPDLNGNGPGGGGGVGDLQDPGHAGENCALNEIRDRINGEPTNDTAEHSAAVYRGTDGRYHSTPVFTGSSGSAPVNDLIIWLIGNGISFDQITSVYHNHDRAGGSSNPNETAVNQYPSHLFAANGYGDWFIAGLFVNPPTAFGQSAGANPSAFRLVVEDTNGNTRSFNYSDRAFYEALSLQDMLNGVGLPPILSGCQE